MSRTTQSYIKSSAAGIIAGGLAFMAVKSLTTHRSFRKMSAAKAFKMIGTLMEAF